MSNDFLLGYTLALLTVLVAACAFEVHRRHRRRRRAKRNARPYGG